MLKQVVPKGTSPTCKNLATILCCKLSHTYVHMYVGASTHVLPELIAESDAHLSNSLPKMTVQHCHQVHIWSTYLQ